MKQTTAVFMRACTLSVALAGSVALVAGGLFPDVAYADNGKGNSGGKGNSSKSSSNSSSKSDNSSAGKSSKSAGGWSSKKTEAGSDDEEVVKPKVAKKPKKPKKKDLASVLNVHPSELGALNAAHASPNALANAAPNSRVGRIADYRDEVVAGLALEATLESNLEELGGMEPPRPLADIATDLEGANQTVSDIEGEIEDLKTALGAATEEEAIEINKLLTQAEEDLLAAQEERDGFVDEQQAALDYQELLDENAEIEALLETQPQRERDLLEAAANKPITDENFEDVAAAVQKLLGL